MNGVDGFVYEGAHKIQTEQTSSLGSRQSAKVLGFVNCSSGETEEEQLVEYISLSESLVGKGTLHIVKDNIPKPTLEILSKHNKFWRYPYELHKIL